MSLLSARARARSAVRAASFALSLAPDVAGAAWAAPFALAPRPLSRPATEGFFARFLSVIHVPDHGIAEPRTAHQRRTRNQQLQVLFDVLARSQLALGRPNGFAQAR